MARLAWRFNASDYSKATLSDHVLKGKAVSADWDAELAPRMSETGICVHEEQVLDELLSVPFVISLTTAFVSRGLP